MALSHQVVLDSNVNIKRVPLLREVMERASIIDNFGHCPEVYPYRNSDWLGNEIHFLI